MENVSKALILSAGVLIGLLILSLAVYLFYVFGEYAGDIEVEIRENALNQFNAKYLKYNGLENLTVQDIVTIKNSVLENNFSYSDYDTSKRANSSNDYIDIFINGKLTISGELILEISDQKLLKTTLENNAYIPKYSCKVQVNQSTGRVNKIFFTMQ